MTINNAKIVIRFWSTIPMSDFLIARAQHFAERAEEDIKDAERLLSTVNNRRTEYVGRP